MGQIIVAMKDLSALGRLFFPELDTGSQAFAAFVNVMNTGDGFDNMQAEASSWLRTCFWNACLDMLSCDKEDDLRVLWLEASEDRRQKALESFSRVMLLRECVDTGYSLGQLEVTADWTTVPPEMIDATRNMTAASIQYCNDQLNAKATAGTCPVNIGEVPPPPATDLPTGSRTAQGATSENEECCVTVSGEALQDEVTKETVGADEAAKDTSAFRVQVRSEDLQ